MRLLPLILAATSALALTACSQAERKEGGAPVDAGASGAGASIAIADFPTLKPGLWRTTTVSNAGEPSVETRCEEARPFEPPESMPGCVDTATRIAGGVRLDRKCLTEGNEATLRVTLTGDFKTRANAEMDYKSKLPNGETIESNERSQSVYLGPCEPGQEPGGAEDGE